MKTILTSIAGVLIVASAILAVEHKTSVASADHEFISPAAQQAYVTHGDMSQLGTDAQIIAKVKAGMDNENYARTAACTTSCTTSCTTTCTTCCSHKCNMR